MFSLLPITRQNGDRHYLDTVAGDHPVHERVAVDDSPERRNRDSNDNDQHEVIEVEVIARDEPQSLARATIAST